MLNDKNNNQEKSEFIDGIEMLPTGDTMNPRRYTKPSDEERRLIGHLVTFAEGDSVYADKVDPYAKLRSDLLERAVASAFAPILKELAQIPQRLAKALLVELPELPSPLLDLGRIHLKGLTEEFVAGVMEQAAQPGPTHPEAHPLADKVVPLTRKGSSKEFGLQGILEGQASEDFMDEALKGLLPELQDPAATRQSVKDRVLEMVDKLGKKQEEHPRGTGGDPVFIGADGTIWPARRARPSAKDRLLAMADKLDNKQGEHPRGTGGDPCGVTGAMGQPGFGYTPSPEDLLTAGPAPRVYKVEHEAGAVVKLARNVPATNSCVLGGDFAPTPLQPQEEHPVAMDPAAAAETLHEQLGSSLLGAHALDFGFTIDGIPTLLDMKYKPSMSMKASCSTPDPLGFLFARANTTWEAINDAVKQASGDPTACSRSCPTAGATGCSPAETKAAAEASSLKKAPARKGRPAGAKPAKKPARKPAPKAKAAGKVSPKEFKRILAAYDAAYAAKTVKAPKPTARKTVKKPTKKGRTK